MKQHLWKWEIPTYELDTQEFGKMERLTYKEYLTKWVKKLGEGHEIREKVSHNGIKEITIFKEAQWNLKSYFST